MKIAVIGGNGKAGSLIAKEAASRGHDVTVIVRSDQTPAANIKAVVKDLFDLSYTDVKDYEVIVDAFGAWTPETLPLHQTTLKHLADILSGKPNRLLVVGGAGSLYVNQEHTKRVMDSPDFPEAFIPLATNMGAALDALRKRDDVNWTYLSPAADFQANGARTGKYTVAGEELTLNAKGQSVISYADYAIAMVDEAENGKHIQKRLSVVGE